MDSGTGQTAPDTDLDGLLDGDEDENRNGRVDDGETDPLRDTDGGGGDGHEVKTGEILIAEDDLAEFDTDGDGLPDHEKIEIKMASSMTMRPIHCELTRLRRFDDLLERIYATNPRSRIPMATVSLMVTRTRTKRPG